MDKNKNPYEENTPEFYDWQATQSLEPLAKDMMQTPSPYRFIKGGIDKVESYCWQALDMDTTFTSAWEKLGYIYAFMHGKQSLLVLKSYEDRGLEEESFQQKAVVAENFIKANLYYDKALEFGSKDSAGVYYAKAGAARLQKHYEHEALYLQKALKMEPERKKYEMELIEAYLYSGRYNQALAQNEQFHKKYPDHEFYYRTLGGYYYYLGEKEAGLFYYEEAAERGSKPEVSMLLHKHYQTLGDTAKEAYYLQKVYDAQNNYQPPQ
ncbi:MAG: hypothetical protein P8100_03430 [bacterium]